MFLTTDQIHQKHAYLGFITMKPSISFTTRSQAAQVWCIWHVLILQILFCRVEKYGQYYFYQAHLLLLFVFPIKEKIQIFKPVQQVTGSTLGIIGFGNIGKAVAEKAKGFNMKILYQCRTPKEDHEKYLGKLTITSPYFPSGIVEWAKREHAWKSPHMRRAGSFHVCSHFARSTIPEGKWRLLIVYLVKGDHHHHLSFWDPGAHVVQTNVCHSGPLLHGGRGAIGLIFGRYMLLLSQNP